MHRALSLAAVVLAAGAGSRFADPGTRRHSTTKLTATLDGKPLLAHVLEATRAAAPGTTVVVLGHGAAAIEAAIEWAGELRVVNHAPERGLASSLQLGIDTLRAMPQESDGAFLVLGDQPRLRPDTMQALARAATGARPADRPAVVPVYADDSGPRNPVLLLRPAWSWVDELTGDDGLATLIRTRSDQVLEVSVEGAMPDVDTPDDLARLAATALNPGSDP